MSVPLLLLATFASLNFRSQINGEIQYRVYRFLLLLVLLLLLLNAHPMCHVIEKQRAREKDIIDGFWSPSQ